MEQSIAALWLRGNDDFPDSELGREKSLDALDQGGAQHLDAIDFDVVKERAPIVVEHPEILLSVWPFFAIAAAIFGQEIEKRLV